MLKKLQERLNIKQIKDVQLTEQEKKEAEKKLIFKENLKTIKENIEITSNK